MPISQKNKIIIASLAFLILFVLIFWKTGDKNIGGGISGWDMLTARPVPSSVTQYPKPGPPGPIPSNLPPIVQGPPPDTRTWREIFQSPIVNPEIKWKTYRDDTYGFEMQYPSDWRYEIRYWEKGYVTEFSFPNMHSDTYIVEFSLGIDKRNKEEYEKTTFHADAFGKISERERMSINSVDCTLVDPDSGTNVLSVVYCAKDGYIFDFSRALGSNYPDMYAYMINTFRFTK